MKDYKKYFFIPAPPDEVYAALTNPVSLQLWTGETAEMNTEPGSEFSLWDGSITGRNMAFEEGKTIIQHWYFGDEPGQSMVTVKLHHDKSGTSLELKHTNIPDRDYEDMVEGWNNSYMASLIEFLKIKLTQCSRLQQHDFGTARFRQVIIFKIRQRKALVGKLILINGN